MTKIDLDKIELVPFSASTQGVPEFENEKSEMTDYIQKDAAREQDLMLSKTWAAIHGGETLVGYITVSMYSVDRAEIIAREPDKKDKYVHASAPAMLIGQLATHRAYEGNGIGKLMVLWAIDQAIKYSERVGCRLVALHPAEDKISWYRKLGFAYLDRGKRHSLMYLDLYDHEI